MAIDLIVQEGKFFPVPGANSFASVAAADKYHEQRKQAEWAALDEDSKKAALINATDFIASEFNFKGRKQYGETDTTRPQFLPFPRADLTDHAGRSIEDTPEGVVRACIELAVYAAKGTLYPQQEQIIKPGGTVKKVTKKIASLTTSYEYASPTQLKQLPIYKNVVRWLSPYTFSGGRIYR